MEDYFNSKKYIILLVIVCVLFTIMTVKVFEYMPKRLETQTTEEYTPKVSINDSQQKDEEDDTQDDEDIDDGEDNTDDDSDDESADENDDAEDTNYNNHKSGHIDFMRSSYPDIKELDEIPAPKGTNEEKIEAH